MDFQSKALFLALALIFINSSFLFMGTLSDGNGGTINFGLSESQEADLNGFTQDYLDMNQMLLGPSVEVDDQVDASTQDKGYLTLFLDYLFAGFGLISSVVGFIGSIFFGYIIWVDLFINPTWFPGLIYINLMVKTFFIIIQLFAMFYIIKDIFGIGTGARA